MSDYRSARRGQPRPTARPWHQSVTHSTRNAINATNIKCLPRRLTTCNLNTMALMQGVRRPERTCQMSEMPGKGVQVSYAFVAYTLCCAIQRCYPTTQPIFILLSLTWHHGVSAATKLRTPNLICGVQHLTSTTSRPTSSWCPQCNKHKRAEEFKLFLKFQVNNPLTNGLSAHIHLRALRDKLLCVLITVSLLLQMLKLVPEVRVDASGTA